MHRFAGRVIELTMLHAPARGHMLHIAGPHHRAVAETILMLQRSRQDVGDDFHVPVRMLAEAVAAVHPVVVDHPETPESHVLGIIIIRKRERVISVEPAMVGVTAVFGFSDVDHSLSLSRGGRVPPQFGYCFNDARWAPSWLPVQILSSSRSNTSNQ